MLEILLIWGYMLFVNTCVGVGVLKLIYRIIGKSNKKVGFGSAVMSGVVAITVYAEFFSIFYKVGMLAHLLLLGIALLFAVLCRDVFIRLYHDFRAISFSWEGVLFVTFAIGIAFFSSRGIQHTDTGIYHAQVIRWYEEYGLVKGLANLQQHFGYNSAYLAYASIFSMKWLLGRSLHATTGFLAAFLCIWALVGMKNVKKHENNLADVCRAGILIYTLVNAEGLMSPATDYATMYLAFYIIVRWAELVAERRAETETEDYALLCVLAVGVTTYKLSAGMLVLLALYPAALLIKGKEWKQIGIWLAAGTLVLLPYLIRNVLLSGWLVYPFGAIDLFSVDWKVPLEYLEHDSAQIKVWGRCLFDVTKLDAPLWEWLPVWWDKKGTYEKMLVEANLAALVLEGLSIAHAVWHKDKIEWDLVALHLAAFGGLIGWFCLAPFIRYGLVFLLEFPLLAMGSWFRHMKNGMIRILAGYCSMVVFFLICYYWSYYTVADMNWVKAYLADPYYLLQQEYDQVAVKEMKVGTLTVYYPYEGEDISYDAFPAVAYASMAERTTMRGSTIEEGFRPK